MESSPLKSQKQKYSGEVIQVQAESMKSYFRSKYDIYKYLKELK